MKILSILFLLILASCGSSGGSSNSTPNIPDVPLDPQDVIYQYDLKVEGAAGTTFLSNTIRNFTEVDEAQLAFSGTLDGSGTSTATIFGRSAFWDFQVTSGAPVTITIIRDGVPVETFTLTNNGQAQNISDNI